MSYIIKSMVTALFFSKGNRNTATLVFHLYFKNQVTANHRSKKKSLLRISGFMIYNFRLVTAILKNLRVKICGEFVMSQTVTFCIRIFDRVQLSVTVRPKIR